jgi:hypothetical protein
VASEAVRVAEKEGRDVVLVDTAGRMQVRFGGVGVLVGVGVGVGSKGDGSCMRFGSVDQRLRDVDARTSPTNRTTSR